MPALQNAPTPCRVNDMITDGAWTLIDHEIETGRSTWMTEQDGQYVFRVDMPLNDIFDQNNDAVVESIGRKFGDYNRVASIPHHLIYKNGVNDAIQQHDSKWLSKWLNDPDNKKFRTSRGRV